MKFASLFGSLMLILVASCKSNSTAEMSDDSSGYNEAHRPQIHFSPRSGWMNDPNGLFYKDGNYHLYFQYYPDSTVWGPMHWGHARSKDLVHWEEQPIALFPDTLGYIFSGSAVVDRLNTSGFGNDSVIPVVALYTYHDPLALEAGRTDFQSQGLAYSLDNGQTWTKYSGNPVLKNQSGIQDFRDPKVVWHEASQRWIMALAVYDRVQLFGSTNLREWQYLSEFGIQGDTRLWECPDLFPIRVAQTREEKWVLLVSIQKDGPNGGTGTSYFVGDFDGTSFQADASLQQWLDWGTDNYAFVTWNNPSLPPHQRLGIGWMSNWQYAQQVPTHPWRSAMTVPRILELHKSKEHYRLKATPVPSLAGLRDAGVSLPLKISDPTDLSNTLNPELGELEFQVNLAETSAESFGITLSNTSGEQLTLEVDLKSNQVLVDRTQSGPKEFSEVFFEGPHRAPLQINGPTLDLRLLLDRASLELFAGEGELTLTEIFFPETSYTGIKIWVRGGELHLNSGMGYTLTGAWNTAKLE